MSDALEQIKVVEFGAYAAGPCIGKYLGNFGAKVVHVESVQQPDGFRLQYPPYKDNKVGLNRSGCFSWFNDSKLDVSINLKNAQGLEVAYQLVEWADVVVENMRNGVMDRLGLSFENLRKRNPKLVMLSTNQLGQTGPYAHHPGFGSQLSSLSGFTNLIGEQDGPPHLLYGPYIDFIAVAFGASAILAALDYTRRTSESIHIDLSQYEAGLQFISSALLGYAANGEIAHRDGNRDPNAVPSGAYPCRAGEWCVISCWDDDEWSRLCRATANDPWLIDLRFSSQENRRKNERELNAVIAEWTRDREACSIMFLLQNSGVHAAVVNTVGDLFSDPQLAFRHTFQAQDHPEMGRHHYRMVSYDLSETPGRVRRPAPCLGEHNSEVLLQWLGMSQDEYQNCAEAGAFS